MNKIRITLLGLVLLASAMSLASEKTSIPPAIKQACLQGDFNAIRRLINQQPPANLQRLQDITIFGFFNGASSRSEQERESFEKVIVLLDIFDLLK